jgi:two-component system, chemotaxis family, CheB/CheR fusion protein
MPVVQISKRIKPAPNTVYVQPPNKCVILNDSVQFPIVMVDGTLTVRLATPAERTAFNILPADIGRRITELRPNIDIPDLAEILQDVIGTLNTVERKAKDLEGREFSLRVRPYRTTDNKIDGAVITLADIEGEKKRLAAKTPNRAKYVSART